MRDYSFSPYDQVTTKLRSGIYRAFVAEIEITGSDLIRGSLVYDNLRFTLVKTATIKQLLPQPADKIKCRASFQFWTDELVCVPKLDSVQVLYSTKLEGLFK